MITDAEEFVSLRQSENPDLYLRAATDSASDDVWRDVIAKFPQMKRWVAHNKTISIEILEVLARDVDAEVRAAVASKNKLSSQLYELLASDRDDSVRQRIAYNKNTPREILEKLCNDPSELVAKASLDRLR